MERCPNCGASVRTGAHFCTACGYRLVQADISSPAAPPSPVDTRSSTDPETSSPIQWSDATLGEDSTPSVGTGTETSDAGLNGDGQSRVESWPSATADHSPVAANSDASTPAQSLQAEPIDVHDDGPAKQHEDAPDGYGTEPSLDAPPDADPTEAVAPAAPDPTLYTNSVSHVAASNDHAQPDGNDDDSRQADVPSVSDLRSQEPVDRGAQPSSDEIASAGDESPPAFGTEPITLSTPSPDGTLADPTDPVSSERQLAVQDDVVIDSTVVHESSWPADHVRAGSGSSTDDSQLARSVSNDGLAIPPIEKRPVDDDTLDDTPSQSDQGADVTPNASGMDADWEPWGTGVIDVPQTTTAQTDAVADDSTSPDANRTAASGPETPTGIDRARELLDELQTTFASLAVPAEPAVDPEAVRAVGLVDQVEQLLDTYSGAGIDAEQMAELQRLAEDLEGRDYDIRALQRFSRERGLILELVQGFQQQQDLLRQISAIVDRTN